MHYRTSAPPPPPSAYQQFLPVTPPVPPPTQMSPVSLPNPAFHNPMAVSSLILAQLQANPLLFSTLLAKTNLAQQQQQQLLLHYQQEQQKHKTHLSPRVSPQPSDLHRPPSPCSAPLTAFPGVSGGSLDLLHNQTHYHEDNTSAASGVLYGTTKEELKLLERSNQEFRNFRESFLTEASKLKLRRGGKRSYSVASTVSSTAPAAATSVSGDTSDSSRGAADDQASEGGIDVMSVDDGDDDDEGSRTENDRYFKVDLIRLELFS